jgi:hypothetical protein
MGIVPIWLHVFTSYGRAKPIKASRFQFAFGYGVKIVEIKR